MKKLKLIVILVIASVVSYAGSRKDSKLNDIVVNINVKNTGATGNGSTDDTKAIQAAIDQVGGTGGTVLVPNGTYMINAITHLNLKSTMTFKMESGAVLKAITNDQSGYAIIMIKGASNVNVVGGTVQGERTTHTGVGGEWGMGIWIDGSINVLIDGVTAKDCWGDGFYIGEIGARNVSFISVVADNNRRQGMSISGSADSIIIKNSIFKNTKGTAPTSGIDIEPDFENMIVQNVQILNSQFINNFGIGIILYHVPTLGQIKNVTIDGCTFTGNGGRDPNFGGIAIFGATNSQVTNNIVKNNMGAGISLNRGATGNTVSGNTVTGNSGNNIEDNVGGNTISGNTIN